MSRHTMFSRKPGRMVQKFNTGDWVTNVPKPSANDRSFSANLCQVIAIDGRILTLRRYSVVNCVYPKGYQDYVLDVNNYNFQRLSKQTVLIHPDNPDTDAAAKARTELLNGVSINA